MSSTASNPATTAAAAAAAAHDLLVEETHAELVEALRRQLSASDVQRIIRKCPEAVCRKDRHRQTPLYEALKRSRDDDGDSYDYCGTGLDVIKCLVEHGPVSLLLEKDYWKQTPLHQALESRANDDVIQYLIDMEPRALHEPEHMGLLPAHLVVDEGHRRRRRSSLHCVRIVVDPYPEALRVRSRSRQLPLTMAVANYYVVSGHAAANAAADDENGPEQQQQLPNEVIKYLVTKCPESVDDADADGMCAVHVAAQVGVPPDLMELLVQARPDALKLRATRAGQQLPIHYAAATSCTTTVAGYASFQLLVNAWPESLQHSNAYGEYPIHIALANCGQGRTTAAAAEVPTIDPIRFILAKCPDAIRFKAGSDERIPLQSALLLDVPHDVLDVLLDAWPDALHQLTKHGESLLHLLALHGGVSVDTLQYLVNRDERILDQRSTADGSLPIHHWAAKEAGGLVNWISPDATVPPGGDVGAGIRFLLERRPSHVHATDNNGSLPLHHALSVPNPAYGVIECLVRCSPASLLTARRVGWLPIHQAVARYHGGSFDVLRLLTDRCPESLRVADNVFGYLPIHLAVSWHGSTKTQLVRFVAERDPGAVLVRDVVRGWTPLHLVVLQRLPDEVATVLIEQQPAAASIGNHDGLVPLHVAAQAGDSACARLVTVLVEAQPDTALIAAHDGRLALHCAAACTKLCLEITQCLVTHCPEAAMVPTGDGGSRRRQLPLHCALEACNDDETSSWLHSLVTILVRAAPESLHVPDGMGHIPLVVAARNPCTPIDVLWLLMTTCPPTVASLRRALTTTATTKAGTAAEN